MNLRRCLQDRLIQCTQQYLDTNNIDNASTPSLLSQVTVEYPPRLELGHYASNVAMLFTKVLKKPPRQIANDLSHVFMNDSFFQSYVSKIEVAGVGFLNIFLQVNAVFSFFFQQDFSLEKWLDATFKGDREKTQKKTHFEFVSANPTGPLNIVSARSAAVGDSICRVLKIVKKEVVKEYYVNDFGNQVHLLGVSFAVRHLESQGISIPIPENGYHGEYIEEILTAILELHNLPDALQDTEGLKKAPKEEVSTWVKQAADFFTPLAIDFILELHKEDLKNFRVTFDHFFSEKLLHDNKEVEKTFLLLSEKGHVYEKEGAFFFKSTLFGDDKDRVIKKKDGTSTYFLADIAYHLNKFRRGYNEIYDIWGPDHHGYIPRLSGALQAIHTKADGVTDYSHDTSFHVVIVQQVNLIENGKAVVMSKRLGKFHSMRDLIEKLPVDVSRYFFVSRSQSQHLNFNLELALDQSPQNHVYYIQYSHARIYSIFREYNLRMTQKKSVDESLSTVVSLSSFKAVSNTFLQEEHLFKAERGKLIFELFKFVDEIDMISENMEIHRLAAYLHNLAHTFTQFYHHPKNRIIELASGDDVSKNEEAHFLLRLCQVTATILETGLDLLGISAPLKM